MQQYQPAWPKFKNNLILIRTDFNVPLKNSGHGWRVADDNKIVQSLPTIQKLLPQKNKLILISHLGRPAGKKKEALSLKPVANALAKLLKKKVILIDANPLTETDKIKNIINQNPAQIFLLENIRFYPEEEKNSLHLAKKLASLGEYFIMDAFGTVHRAHASTEALARLLPSYPGLLVAKEYHYLHQALGRHPRPAVAIMGGAKISGKIEIITNLLEHFDHLLLGGALANNFLLVAGNDIKGSKYEPNCQPLAKRLLKRYSKKIVLPIDFSWGTIDGQPAILDIGPRTRRLYAHLIKQSRTAVWNGPLGFVEDRRYTKGTLAVMRALASSRTQALIGGGDTLGALKKIKLKTKQKNVYYSTGGGAMLEFLAGQPLPGLKNLKLN
jgi:phosphoglycerate kinase